MRKIRKSFFLLVLLIVLGVGAMIAGDSFFTVKFGSTGLITRFGQIIGEPLGPGLHVKIPFIDNVVIYRTQKIVYQTLYGGPSSSSNVSSSGYYPAQSANIASDSKFTYESEEAPSTINADYTDYEIDTTTKDGQQVKITYSIRFALDPEKIVQIANTLGTESEVVDKVIKTDSRVWARNIPRSYSALDLYTGNIDKVSLEIKDVLSPIFADNGIILDEFYIRSIHFTQEYVQTIENKQIEKEKIATEEFKAQQEEYRKQALITKAQGEAEAQRLQQQTLTAQLIQKLFIEKWNGILPTTMTGDGANLLLNLMKQ